jgi:GLTT repeat (6 copies)
MRTLLLTAAAAVALACSTAEQPSILLDEMGQPVMAENGLSTNGLSTNGMTTNGMTTNGMTTNGMTTNGLSTNGLSTNGLSTNGLLADAFGTWFEANPTVYSDMLMKYLVRCALPAGQSLSATVAGVGYSWAGELGLAPIWAAGLPAPEAEQQLVSACLAAHANKYGLHVAISVRGFHANGITQIAHTSSEAQTFTAREGCFFGNLFDGTGVFTAYEGSSPLAQPGRTSARACVLSDGRLGSCLPMTATGRSCGNICDNGGGGIYSACQWNGKWYRSVQTRLQPADVYSCGDGVCQFTESCSSATVRGCTDDCGYCK